MVPAQVFLEWIVLDCATESSLSVSKTMFLCGIIADFRHLVWYSGLLYRCICSLLSAVLHLTQATDNGPESLWWKQVFQALQTCKNLFPDRSSFSCPAVWHQKFLQMASAAQYSVHLQLRRILSLLSAVTAFSQKPHSFWSQNSVSVSRMFVSYSLHWNFDRSEIRFSFSDIFPKSLSHVCQPILKTHELITRIHDLFCNSLERTLLVSSLAQISFVRCRT